MGFHLAQFNIGRLIAPLDDPRIAGFVSQLEPINALADSAPYKNEIQHQDNRERVSQPTDFTAATAESFDDGGHLH